MTFLLAAILVHASLGYTLGEIAFERPKTGALTAILPDVDLLFPTVLGPPFVHRGITHTLLAAAIVVAVTSPYGRRVAGAAGLGYVSHLLVDATTPAGVPLAYPLVTDRSEIVLHGHAPIATVVILVCCLLVLAYHRHEPAAIVD